MEMAVINEKKGSPSGSRKAFLALCWISLGAVILALDYTTGENTVESYALIFPVVLAARYNGLFLGLILAILLPFIRFLFNFYWAAHIPILDAAFNLLIRSSVLVGAAFLINRITLQAQEIRRLSGCLPMCAFCKKIRDEKDHWSSLETYVSQHSDAQLSHTFCPECSKKHYGRWMGDSNSPTPSQKKEERPV
jgi:hypothetical protein